MVAGKLRISVFCNTAEAKASVAMLLKTCGATPAFAKSRRDADVVLSCESGIDKGVASVRGCTLEPDTARYASLINCFSRKPKRSLAFYSFFTRWFGLKPPKFLKNLRARQSGGIPAHADYAARLRFEFVKALQAEKIVGSRTVDCGVLLTHDVDSLDSFRKVRELLELERSFGFKSFWFVVFNVREAFFEEFPELEKRSFSHGLNHDGTLVSSSKIIRERVPKCVWNDGFRAPWLHHSTELFEELAKNGARFDSSIPNFENTTPFFPPGGCGEIIPFPLLNREFKEIGLTEFPVTLHQDYALYNRFNASREEVTDYYAKRIEFLATNGGLINLLTHPDLKDSGSRQGLKNYESALQELEEYRKFQFDPRQSLY